ncbi:hypothetical protein LTR56_004369 [Elasticomyces elasticus]|nr:hypothetical protein LTR22_012097 [Elasticomyces elasticus]KAK3653957.1 hypothetical protein LTR56_004369 [Elasticomyces elasticus]KAK4917156.1 hypothetical protein LTR49_014921 [Elasticomyces elasticus]KAK5757115.1 hypothetical protein LTS12_012789 [Elasticomyces elasticus]
MAIPDVESIKGNHNGAVQSSEKHTADATTKTVLDDFELYFCIATMVYVSLDRAPAVTFLYACCASVCRDCFLERKNDVRSTNELSMQHYIDYARQLEHLSTEQREAMLLAWAMSHAEQALRLLLVQKRGGSDQFLTGMLMRLEACVQGYTYGFGEKLQSMVMTQQAQGLVRLPVPVREGEADVLVHSGMISHTRLVAVHGAGVRATATGQATGGRQERTVATEGERVDGAIAKYSFGNLTDAILVDVMGGSLGKVQPHLSPIGSHLSKAIAGFRYLGKEVLVEALERHMLCEPIEDQMRIELSSSASKQCDTVRETVSDLPINSQQAFVRDWAWRYATSALNLLVGEDPVRLKNAAEALHRLDLDSAAASRR